MTQMQDKGHTRKRSKSKSKRDEFKQFMSETYQANKGQSLAKVMKTKLKRSKSNSNVIKTPSKSSAYNTAKPATKKKSLSKGRQLSISNKIEKRHHVNVYVNPLASSSAKSLAKPRSKSIGQAKKKTDKAKKIQTFGSRSQSVVSIKSQKSNSKKSKG